MEGHPGPRTGPWQSRALGVQQPTTGSRPVQRTGLIKTGGLTRTGGLTKTGGLIKNGSSLRLGSLVNSMARVLPRAEGHSW